MTVWSGKCWNKALHSQMPWCLRLPVLGRRYFHFMSLRWWLASWISVCLGTRKTMLMIGTSPWLSRALVTRRKYRAPRLSHRHGAWKKGCDMASLFFVAFFIRMENLVRLLLWIGSKYYGNRFILKSRPLYIPRVERYPKCGWLFPVPLVIYTRD